MIDLVVPLQDGGVHAFGSVLCGALGSGAARLVPLRSNSQEEWQPDAADAVFLQYSGYGYAKRGAPFWLISALKSRRAEVKKIGVYFHELYATGPPWTSSFWLSPLQRYICRALAELSDFWITNRQASAQWLKERTSRRPHAVLPVFSCVGEGIRVSDARRPRIVVFGGAGLRQGAYRAVGERLLPWARRMSLEVHDVGPALEDANMRTRLRTQGVVEHGYLGDEAVSEFMLGTMFGLLAYPIGYAAKSSVLAAYCAHGLCPVVISTSHEQADGLVADGNYLPGLPFEISTAQVQRIGRAANEWYAGHRVEVHARTLMRLAKHAQAIEECEVDAAGTAEETDPPPRPTRQCGS